MRLRSVLLLMTACTGLGLVTSQAGADQTYVCQSGGGMDATNGEGGWTITFRSTGSTPPGEGECAAKISGEEQGPPLAEGGEGRLNLPRIQRATEVFAAAKGGGSFTIKGTEASPGVIDVTKISDVVITETQDDGNGDVAEERDDGGMNADEEDNAGMEDDGGECGTPGSVATVSIDDPDLDKLNVRTKPGGKVKGTVPEGDEVTLDGICGTTNAGFAASKKTTPSGWCKISAPIRGCVKAEFLSFDGGGFDGGAGLVAHKKKKRKN